MRQGEDVVVASRDEIDAALRDAAQKVRRDVLTVAKERTQRKRIGDDPTSGRCPPYVASASALSGRLLNAVAVRVLEILRAIERVYLTGHKSKFEI